MKKKISTFYPSGRKPNACMRLDANHDDPSKYFLDDSQKTVFSISADGDFGEMKKVRPKAGELAGMLSNRKQYVDFLNNMSAYARLYVGVP